MAPWAAWLCLCEHGQLMKSKHIATQYNDKTYQVPLMTFTIFALPN